jgi:hypothetical protein
MTLYHFNALAYEDRLAAVNKAGTHVATRWKETTVILLYHLPGEVFAEVSYNIATNAITDVQAFTSAAPLQEYADAITLPEGLDELEGL